MHLYIVTRGAKHAVERAMQDLEAQYFKWKHKGEDCHVQLGVRPIQLWELVFPREELPVMMNTLWENETHIPYQFKKTFKMIGKMIGCKPMPKFDKKSPKRIINPLFYPNLAVYPIGVKDDIDHPKDKHEML